MSDEDVVGKPVTKRMNNMKMIPDIIATLILMVVAIVICIAGPDDQLSDVLSLHLPSLLYLGVPTLIIWRLSIRLSKGPYAISSILAPILSWGFLGILLSLTPFDYLATEFQIYPFWFLLTLWGSLRLFFFGPFAWDMNRRKIIFRCLQVYLFLWMLSCICIRPGLIEMAANPNEKNRANTVPG